MKTTIKLLVLLFTAGLATGCGGGGGGDDFKHEHSWSSAWTYDNNSHWHACSGCEEQKDKADHQWGAPTVTKAATAYAPGEQELTCTVCQRVKKEVIPATGGNEAQGNFTFNETQLNTVQDIHTTNQNGYLNLNKEYYSMNGDDLDSFGATGSSGQGSPKLTKESWAPNAVTVSWNYTAPSGKTVTNYNFVYGQKADLGDAYQLPSAVTTNSVSFTNAYLGTNYFKVIANLSDGSKEASQIKSFKVVEQCPRNLDVGNMPNCRDMGGRTTYAGGKIRQGLIYRTSGSKFDNSTNSDATAKSVLTDLLRVKTEINVANSTTNNVNLTGVTVQNCYMDYGSTPYSNLARNAEKIRNVIEILSDANNYPAFYHCRIGTDRTGITGVIVGGLIGIKFNEIIQDYGFSNFSPIDNQRYPGKPNDTNGDDIKKYIDEILALPGANFQEQTYLALRLLGIPAYQLNAIIDIMTEGAKATLPDTALIGKGDSLESSGTRKTDNSYNAPAVYYQTAVDESTIFNVNTTAGKKDVIVYMGTTDSSQTDKLASKIDLYIDGVQQSIIDRTMHRCGFGETAQNHRTGYMFNILGNYDLSAGGHSFEIYVNNGTFNIATIAVVDRA